MPQSSWAQAGDGEAPLGSPPVVEPTPPGGPQPEDAPDHAGPTGEAGVAPDSDSNGLIALFRSDEAVQGPVSIVLSGPDGRAEIPLNDAGNAPDVTAGDGIWAGLAESAPLSASVDLVLPTGSQPAGEVSWNAEDRARELKVQIRGGALEARASTHAQAPAPPSSPPAKGDPPVDGGAAPAAPPSTGGVAQPVGPAAAPSSSTDWLGGVALVVALAALGVVLLRRPAGDADPQVAAPELPPVEVPVSAPLPARMAEVGLLGPDTPSPSDGLSIWTGPAKVLGPLLGTLARHRPVVVAAAPGTELPQVAGGPVFRAPSLEPAAIAAAVQAVRQSGGLSVVVVWIASELPPPDALIALVEGVPDGVGVLVFTSKAPVADSAPSGHTWPVVTLGAVSGGVSVMVDGQAVRQLRASRRGFQLG